MVHEDLFTKRLPYFEKCLQVGFAKGETIKVKLEEDYCAGFNVFVIWVFNSVVKGVDGTTSERDSAIEVWVPGDKWCMHEFQNETPSAFMSCHHSGAAPADDLLYICQLCSQESRLDTYVFDQLACDLVPCRKNQFGSHRTTTLSTSN